MPARFDEAEPHQNRDNVCFIAHIVRSEGKKCLKKRGQSRCVFALHARREVGWGRV